MLEALIEQQAMRELQAAAKKRGPPNAVPIWKRDEERARQKQAKLQMIASQADETELGQCTFAPTINAKSSQIAPRRGHLTSPTVSTAAKIRRTASHGPFNANTSFDSSVGAPDDVTFSLEGFDSLSALSGLGAQHGFGGGGGGGMGPMPLEEDITDIPHALLAQHRAAYAPAGPPPPPPPPSDPVPDDVGRVDAAANAAAAAKLAAGAVRGAGGGERARSRAASNASQLVSVAAAASAGAAHGHGAGGIRSRANSVALAAATGLADDGSGSPTSGLGGGGGGVGKAELALAVDAALAALGMPPTAPAHAGSSPSRRGSVASTATGAGPARRRSISISTGGGHDTSPSAAAVSHTTTSYAGASPPPSALASRVALLEYELGRAKAAHAAEVARIHETYQVRLRGKGVRRGRQTDLVSAVQVSWKSRSYASVFVFPTGHTTSTKPCLPTLLAHYACRTRSPPLRPV